MKKQIALTISDSFKSIADDDHCFYRFDEEDEQKIIDALDKIQDEAAARHYQEELLSDTKQ